MKKDKQMIGDCGICKYRGYLNDEYCYRDKKAFHLIPVKRKNRLLQFLLGPKIAVRKGADLPKEHVCPHFQLSLAKALGAYAPKIKEGNKIPSIIAYHNPWHLNQGSLLCKQKKRLNYGCN